jgi:hypothetical protein
MSQILGKELTEALFGRLNGNAVQEHEGKIIPIFTVEERGWAHPALLSYYEVVAKDRSTLDMALWKDSSTARNLRRSGKVTLMVTDQAMNYYLKGTVTELQAEMAGAPPVSHFRVAIQELVEDQEPNARITSGMTYSRRTDRAANDFAVKVFRLLRAQP